MRTILSLAAFVGATAAAAAPAIQSVPNQAHRARNAAALYQGVDAQQERGRVCRDRIRVAREERGLPSLDRGTASADEPLMILAVDKRIDGCSVMVMAYDTSDIRPLPALPEGPPRVRKIQ